MQFLISRDLTFNVSPGCEGNVSSVACAHLHSFPKAKVKPDPNGAKMFLSPFCLPRKLKIYICQAF